MEIEFYTNLFILVPHSRHIPFIIERPFLAVALRQLTIVLGLRHLTQ
jgi:hypothetical protein